MRPPVGVVGPPVPIQEAVGEFVNALVGRGCAASKVTPTSIERDGSRILAAYRDTHGTVLAVTVADLDFAAGTGASLGMIPANAAHESAAAGVLEDTLFENYQEVANIMMSLLNSPNSPHLALDGVWASDAADVPDEVWALVEEPGKRREFAVTIEGYGDGHLGVIVA